MCLPDDTLPDPGHPIGGLSTGGAAWGRADDRRYAVGEPSKGTAPEHGIPNCAGGGSRSGRGRPGSGHSSAPSLSSAMGGPASSLGSWATSRGALLGLDEA